MFVNMYGMALSSIPLKVDRAEITMCFKRLSAAIGNERFSSFFFAGFFFTSA